MADDKVTITVEMVCRHMRPIACVAAHDCEECLREKYEALQAYVKRVGEYLDDRIRMLRP